MSNSAFTPTTTEVTTEVPVNVPTLTTGQVYSPTLVSVGGSNLGLARTQVTWRQVGNYVHIQGTLVKDANAGSGANVVGITMPSGLTIDFTQAGGTTATDGFVVGSFGSYNLLATNQYDRQLTAYVRGTGGNFANNAVYIQVPASGSTYTASQITANSTMYVNLMIPVAEWAGTGTTTLATRAVEEYAFNTSGITAAGATNTTSFANGPAGATIGSIASTTGASSVTAMRCRFLNEIQATDKIQIEVSSDGNRWHDVANVDAIKVASINTAEYGISYRIVNSTDVDVYFGNQGRSAATAASYAGSGLAWSGISTWKWRLRKISGGAQVGYPVSARNIVGDTSGTTVPTGMIGEVLYATATTTGLGTSITVGYGGSITLTPGVWLVQSHAFGSGQAPVFLNSSLADSSNVEISQDSTGAYCFNQVNNATGSNALGLSSGSYYINVSSNTVRKSRFAVSFVNPGGTIVSSIRAIRIA